MRADAESLEASGFAATIGLIVDELTPESARARVEITDALRQPFGLLHGGIHSVIAESICSRATSEAVAAEGMIAIGQSNAATFLRPITSGHVHAAARRRHRGRTSWVWDVELSDDDGRLCAMVRMTIAVRPAPTS